MKSEGSVTSNRFCGIVPSPPQLWYYSLTLLGYSTSLHLLGYSVSPTAPPLLGGVFSPPGLWCCPLTPWATVLFSHLLSYGMLTPHLLSGGIVPSLLSCGVGLSPPELGCEEQPRCSCSMPCCSPRVAAIPWERVAVLVICFNLRNRNPLKPSQISKIY